MSEFTTEPRRLGVPFGLLAPKYQHSICLGVSSKMSPSTRLVLLVIAFLAHRSVGLSLFGIEISSNDAPVSDDYDDPAASHDDTRWQVHTVSAKPKSKEIDAFLAQLASDDPEAKCNQDGIVLSNIFGFLSEPYFLLRNQRSTTCKWILKSNFPADVIVLSLEKLHIQNSSLLPAGCEKMRQHFSKRCCPTNYLKIVEGSEGEEEYHEHYYCGSLNVSSRFSSPARVIITHSNQVSIEFHIGKAAPVLPSFSLGYITSASDAHQCPAYQFHCGTGHCIPHRWRCNGLDECGDGSDEAKCFNATATSAPLALWRCSESSNETYSERQRCDGLLDCANAADELDCNERCAGLIACKNGKGCFHATHRCNGVNQCKDHSDELNCSPELCGRDRQSILCPDGKCVSILRGCEQASECFDGSHDYRCLQNGTITAVFAGALLLFSLVTIAMSCAYKLLTLRRMQVQRRHVSSGHQHSRSATLSPSSLPLSPFNLSINPGELDAPLFNSLLLRDPPPSYHQVMLESGFEQTGGEINSSYLEYYRRYRRRTNRSRRSNRRFNPCDSIAHRIAGLAVPEDTSSVLAMFNDSNLNTSNMSNSEPNVSQTMPAHADDSLDGDHSKKNCPSSDAKNDESQQAERETQTIVAASSRMSHNANDLVSIRTNPLSNLSNLMLNESMILNIELETMPAPDDDASGGDAGAHLLPPHFDCDSQPLITQH